MADPRAPTPPLRFVFLLAILFHLLDVFLGRLSEAPVIPSVLFFALYVLLAVLAWLAIRSRATMPTATSIKLLVSFIGISVLAFYLPVWANKLGTSWLTTTSVYVVGSIVLFAPIWVLYFGFFGGEDAIGKGFMWLFEIYIIVWFIWVLITVLPVVQTLHGPLNAESSAMVSPGTLAKNAWTTLVSGVQRLMNSTQQQALKQLNAATGDAFTGRVDSKAKEKLGITMGEIFLTQQKFSTQDSIGAYTTIVGESLDAPLALRVSCTSPSTPSKEPKIAPATLIDLGSEESVDVDCTYPEGSFKQGSATVTIGATFTTDTLAYLKTYLMEKERLRDLRENKIDPFQQYGITDRNPVTVYTSGPVNIGMGFGTPPLGIDLTKDEYTGTLGVTLSNAWTGKISSIEYVLVVLPRGFTVTELTGAGTVQPMSCLDLTPIKDWCDDEVSTAYKITPTISGPILSGNAYTVRAQLRAHRPEYPLLLGNTPLSTRYFKAAARYNYTLEKSITADVRDATTGTTGCQDLTKDTVKNFNLVANANDATITFTTDIPAATEVRYCIGSSIASCSYTTVSSPTSSTQHSLHLDGLTSETLYSYQVNGVCAGKRTNVNEGTFTTPAAS